MQRWVIDKKVSVFKSGVFSLIKNQCHHNKSGVVYDFYTIDTRDWINVVARTVEGDYILVRQHRLGTDEITLETPGGLIEESELPEQCARRELLEETGYSCESIRLIKKLSANPAIMNNYLYIYYADGCKKVADQCLDEAEDIDIITLEEAEVKNSLGKGDIHHSIVVLALNLFFNCSSSR